MDKVKVKVSEAEGQVLDWMVNKASDLTYEINYEINYEIKGGAVITGGETVVDGLVYDELFEPSTDWSQGGPIIEREGLGLWYSANVVDENGTFLRDAGWYCETAGGTFAVGPTPLIAAMRCYVASKLGDEVDVPEELE